ncbi:MAG: hypothetical protein WC497_00870 [Patescibacteria group bacterium]
MNGNNQQTTALDWHDRWKAFPHHNQVHWLVLVVIVWAMGLVFMGQMVNMKNSSQQLAQAVVLGERTKRTAPTPATNAIPEVKGETTGPTVDDNSANHVLPSEVNKQDFRPARIMNQHLKK